MTDSSRSNLACETHRRLTRIPNNCGNMLVDARINHFISQTGEKSSPSDEHSNAALSHSYTLE